MISSKLVETSSQVRHGNDDEYASDAEDKDIVTPIRLRAVCDYWHHILSRIGLFELLLKG
jgi:hypothetical protein